MKKIISLIMSICMMITGLPMMVYAMDSTPEISLEEFTTQLQDLQNEYDDNYVSEITIENDKEFYHIDGEEFPVSEDCETTATVAKDDFEIPLSAIEPYVELPESSTYSMNENFKDMTVDKETAKALGFEVDIEDDKAVLTQPYQTERLIVKSKYDINPLDSVAIVEGYNDLHIVQFDNQESAKKAEKFYNNQQLIEYAEPDLVMSTLEIDYFDKNPTFVNSIDSYGSHLSWGSDSIAVDDYIDTLSEIEELPEIVVGIIDTGIDLDHEFLKDRIIETNYNTSSSGEKSSENDDEGHGTHVAGIVADNTTNNVKLKGYKVLNSQGSGSSINIINAIQTAVSEKVDVINLSLGAPGKNSAMAEIINNAVKKGITVCVAAGNSGANANNYSPACIENCITVAAIDFESDFPSWTNWGSCVDIIAPGVSINSTYNNGSYEILSGTSMASPFVAAASALLLSKNQTMKPNEICVALQESSRECSPPEKLMGVKNLYIGNALDYNSERTITPIINIPSGYYEDSITVEILCDDKNAKIYYTTDGTRASESNGILYTKPITIDKITSLHAAAYSPNKLKSLQVYETYYISYVDDESNFTIDSNGIITEYKGNNTYLIIPDKINNITVTEIGYEVFYKSDMVRITFPDTLTYIGDYAFFNNKSLVSVKGKNIKNIADHGFDMCRSLDDIDLSNVETIGRFACYGIPIVSIYNDKLISIDENAFSHCQKLLSINLPNVTELNNSVFSTCDRLENATFLSLEVIGNNAFSSTIRMENFYAPNVITVGIQSFYNAKKLKEINFPKLCDTIPKNAFRNCKYLKTLFVPKAETIETGVLDGCTSLNTIFAPNLKSTQSLPNCNNIDIYLSDSCVELPITEFSYNIIAPKNSYAKQWTTENGHTFIPCDNREENTENPANVTDLGRSICCSAAGVRFGFTWDNIDEIESLASNIEYGFIYSQKGVENLSIDAVDNTKVKKIVANNRINHGDTTSFNLVISNIPKSYYDREITARAYVCIDGMYFYSNIQKGSFSEVAGLVLADDEIDQNTKNAVNNLLNKEV